MKKERVKSAISHIQTDVIPYNIELTSTLGADLCNYLEISKNELWEWLGNHIEKVGYNRGRNLANDIYEDEYGVKWDRSGLDKDIGIIKEYVLKEPELTGFQIPKPDLINVKTSTLNLINNDHDSFKLGKIGTALFERAWSLRGFENFLMDLMIEEDFVNDIFKQITDFNLQIIDEAVKYDIDGFYFGDDYGQQNGLLMSPTTWRSLIKPYLAIMFERVKKSGKIVVLHSCGNISEIMGDLIDIGLDVYQTFQPELYDLEQVKKQYGSHLTFWGGISTQQSLPFVKPSELKEIVNNTIKIMGKNGGYIAAPTHQVPADVPLENIIALADILKNQK